MVCPIAPIPARQRWVRLAGQPHRARATCKRVPRTFCTKKGPVSERNRAFFFFSGHRAAQDLLVHRSLTTYCEHVRRAPSRHDAHRNMRTWSMPAATLDSRGARHRVVRSISGVPMQHRSCRGQCAAEWDVHGVCNPLCSESTCTCDVTDGLAPSSDDMGFSRRGHSRNGSILGLAQMV